MADGANEVRGCGQTSLVGAYLDRELDQGAAAGFEAHAGACPDCSAALLEQRRLLCLLDAAFDQTFGRVPPLPRDFTRAVKARAQTDMSGVRAAGERVRAVKICAALSVAAFGLLGVAAFGPLLDAARAAGGLLGVAGRAAADAGAGAGIIVRAGAPGTVAPLLLAVCAGAFLLLLWLIGSYHRGRD